MRSLLERALHSKVAVRMAVLFIACAVAPLVGLALLTLNRTTVQLETDAKSRLRYDVKAVSMGALERLSLLEGTLRVIGATVAGTDPGTTPPAVERLGQTLGTATPALAYFPERGSSHPIRGRLDLPAIAGTELAHLDQTGRLLAAAPPSQGVAHTLLVRIDGSGGRGIAAAVVNQRALFELDDDQLPPYSDVCVFQARRVLVCSAGAPDDVVRQMGAPIGEGSRISGATGSYLAARWTIPLKASYGAEPWTAVMIRPEAAVLGPLRKFARDFWLVLALSVMVVTLVAIGQVRRQLSPVASLVQATRRMARRDFDHPVQVRSADEFEELGQSFNALAVELKHQFGELEAFNLGTLAALARAIDAKSPWTAGHSERVTKLAVALAIEMQIPDQDVEDLRRGGLIHDIGKLATPPGILDKPGNLTDEERVVIEDHTRRGVHILEPIPGYGRLLPIVGQHHERWDGAGYPDRLKGTEIARTARVLAVADVCDALHSDRPYRKGMPWPELIEFIRAQSGKQFDPEVVDALMRLDPRHHGRAA